MALEADDGARALRPRGGPRERRPDVAGHAGPAADAAVPIAGTKINARRTPGRRDPGYSPSRASWRTAERASRCSLERRLAGNDAILSSILAK